MSDLIMPSPLRRGPEAAETAPDSKKGRGDQPEEGHVNAKLLRQLESRMRTLIFGAGLAVHGPSDSNLVGMLKATCNTYQKQVPGKANAHGLGPPKLQSLAALLSGFSAWFEQQSGAQNSVKQLKEIPEHLLLMLQKSDMQQASL
ncbi:unnamed protein product [Prorocentrum cordatum]|uniref:Uncharacterized protein n=1 Tax=Prorocentrum cordatum TaxID=2364126 RepID=A0ABN9RM37_9DINO|nr:unnamed protein product [Polarella glacialis]